MTVLALCCTHGRYKCLQRSLRCFIDQDYQDQHVMFIYNSGDPLFFDKGVVTFSVGNNKGESEMSHVYSPTKSVCIYNVKATSYNSVGEKYQHALETALSLYPMTGIVYSHDDDDIYLPNHISEGIKGMQKALLQGKYAYKSKYSYFRSDKGIIKNENTYEPSIFVEARYLKQEGYANVNIKYHQQWLDPLIIRNAIVVDSNGPSTFVYNWGDSWDTYKMSGSGDDSSLNMLAHRRRSNDMGNGILTPNPDNSSYYDEVKLIK